MSWGYGGRRVAGNVGLWKWLEADENKMMRLGNFTFLFGGLADRGSIFRIAAICLQIADFQVCRFGARS